jgi:RNA polymerase sigma-70 factor (ECF subfamily)
MHATPRRPVLIGTCGARTPVATVVAVGAPDPESREWVAALNAGGPEREAAVARLHALLLGAARFELLRRRPEQGFDVEDVAMQSANDALMAILRKLDSYRGQSRFSTWAYKFALLEAGANARRRAWQRHELPLAQDGWARLADSMRSPHAAAGSSELLRAIGEAIEQRLTPHQREVIVALALNEVPIDVLAERLATTRGALYKTLHDARRKLRHALTEAGMSLDFEEERP